MTVTVRFAPSPTGKLHVGNVRAALWNWLFARGEGGRFILRIDDTDEARSTKAFEDGIKEDLTWLGLNWDETFNQSDRFAEYDGAAEKLKSAGLLYACYETPEELDRKRKLQRARGLPPVYDRAGLEYTDEQLAAFKQEGRRPHWRFKLSQTPVSWDDLIRGETVVDTASVSDPVLIREDGQYLYTLPSCVDDIDAKITHVIRGEDHVTNTAVQVEIFKSLGGAAPRFAHHSLLVGSDGEGLSKRLGSLSIEGMREGGLEPASITSLLARLGTSEPVVAEPSLKALSDAFSFKTAGRAPARFNDEDLDGLNAKLLQSYDFALVEDRLAPLNVGENLWMAVRGNLSRVTEAADWRVIVEEAIAPVIEDTDFCSAAAELVPDGPLTTESWGAFTTALKENTGAKGKKLFMPLRLALTGQAHGPDMGPLFMLIGPEKARARLNGQTA